MIMVKMRPWNPQELNIPTDVPSFEGGIDIFSMKQTSMRWQLATDPEFKNIIDEEETTEHLDLYRSDNNVPTTGEYYLRGVRIMNNGQAELNTETVVLKANETEKNNVIRDDDLYIEEPTVYINENDVLRESKFTIKTSKFRCNGDFHKATHWYILNSKGEILFSSVGDTKNLTSIDIDNEGQSYALNTRLTFKAIHVTNQCIESKTGTYEMFINHSNFEIEGNTSNVTPYKDLVLKFKRIDPNFRLGVFRITLKVNNLSKELFLNNDNCITIPWWYLSHGDRVELDIDTVDTLDNITVVKRVITVASYGYKDIIDRHRTYKKHLSGWKMEPGEETPGWYIPNNYYAEPLHNGYIPIPKLGDNKLYAYEIENDYLVCKGEFKGFELEKDSTFEDTCVKKVGDDVVMISTTVKDGTGANVHQLQLYKYNLNLDSYKLYKSMFVPDERLGLGYNNSIVQVDGTTIYYIPAYMDVLRKLDMESLGIETISDNIPGITPIPKDKLEQEKPYIVTPLLLNREDKRLLIGGGYTSILESYDYINKQFRQEGYWGFSTYVKCRLSTVKLYNGDYIVYKKDKPKITADEVQDFLTKEETVQEAIDEINKIGNLYETKLNVDLEKIDTVAGDTVDIPLYGNLTPGNDDQYYVVYDETALDIVSKTSSLLRVRSFGTNAGGEYKITIVASKDQVYNDKNEATLDYTYNVIRQDITLSITRTREDDSSGLPDDSNGYYTESVTTTMESEGTYFLGKKYTYGKSTASVKCFKLDDEILLPFEIVNVDTKDIALEVNKAGLNFKVELLKITGSLAMVRLRDFLAYDDIIVTIVNKQRNVTMLSIRVEFVNIPDTITKPNKLSFTKLKKQFTHGNTLCFTELSDYNIYMNAKFPDVVITPNRSDVVKAVKGIEENEYVISSVAKGCSYLYFKYDQYPDDIYTNTIVFINNVNLVPVIDIADPDIMLKVTENTKAKLLNDFSGYQAGSNEGYKVEIIQDELSKSLINIVREGNNLTFIPKFSTGESTFTIKLINNEDGVSKTMTFKFKVVDEEEYTKDYALTFTDLVKVTDTLYVNPGEEIPFSFTKNGYKNTLVPDEGDTFIDKDKTVASLEDTTPKLFIKDELDLGSTGFTFNYYNKNQAISLKMHKNVIVTPAIFYVNDQFTGRSRVDTNELVVDKGVVTDITLEPKVQEGYKVTSVRLVTDKVYTDGVRYSLRLDTESNTCRFRIEPPKGSNVEDYLYSFKISYTYTNSNGNMLMTIEDEHMQTIKVRAVTYMEETYIVGTGRMKLDLMAVRPLTFKTNGKVVQIEPENEYSLEIDKEKMTIKALQVVETYITVKVGGPGQRATQETIYISVNEPTPEEEKPMGEAIVSPSYIRVLRSNRADVVVKTNGDTYKCKVDDRNIAIWDDITNQVIGIKPGETNLTVTYSGPNIKTGTKKIPIKVINIPEGDSDIIYYDRKNNEFSKTEAYFTEHVPRSALVTRHGDVILAVTKNVEVIEGTETMPIKKEVMKSLYCMFT